MRLPVDWDSVGPDPRPRWPRPWLAPARSTCPSTMWSPAIRSPPPAGVGRDPAPPPVTGRLRSLADGRRPGSAADRFRQRRFARFRELVDGIDGPIRILDVGGTTVFWERVGYAGHDRIEIVLLNLMEQPAPHDNMTSTVGDAADLSPYADDTFDIVVSNSVIEHLPTRSCRRAWRPRCAGALAEVRRDRLTGKTALVTGGSRGIGRAIVLRLATQGADVAFTYRGNAAAAAATAADIEALGRRALAVQADASDGDAAEGVVKAVARGVRQGRHPGQQRGDHPRRSDHADERRGVARRPRDEPLRRVLDDQGRHPPDAQGPPGRIINITSVSGQAGQTGQANYSAAKAGLIGLTKATARELASRTITVNAVAPGFVLTELTKDLPEALQAEITARTPLGPVRDDRRDRQRGRLPRSATRRRSSRARCSPSTAGS